MRSTLLRERSLHVELRTLLAAPVATNLAGQVCHNRGGDARPWMGKNVCFKNGCAFRNARFFTTLVCCGLLKHW